MRRVALISEHASPLATLGGVDSGGQNVYVAQLARHLASMGYAVDVLTRRDDASQPRMVEWAGARVIHVPAGPPARVRKEELLPYMDEFTANVAALCRKEGEYNLLHANFFMSALVAADLKRMFGTPFVVTFHALGRVRRLYQGDADGFPAERLKIEQRVVADADAIIAECPQDADDLITLYGASSSRIEMIPCGFDPSEFGPLDRGLARLEIGVDPHVPLLLQLGRMVPRKGVDNVIRGLGCLQREYSIPALLLIVGGDSRRPDPEANPEIARLQQIGADEGVSEAVVFVGSRGRQELRTYYAAADVFVTTPWYEPFGITPVEAMACGTPVIGASVGGIKYTVRHGETGYLVPPNDPQALAARLAECFRHPTILKRLGVQARRRAESLFTWKRVAHLVADLYEHVCGVHAPLTPETARSEAPWSQSEAAI